jgi:sugar phosphate isomerase/epimerase
MDLEIGLCCGVFMQLGLPDLIELAGRHGFPTITVRPASYVQAQDAGWTDRRLRRLLADAGVRVTQIDALQKGMPGAATAESFPPALRARLPLDVLDPPDEAAVFRAAEGLGAAYVNVALFGGSPTPFDRMVDGIAAACRRAAQRGLSLALEFVPDTPLPDIRYSRRVIEAAGEPNCRLTLDFWHLDRSGGTIDDIRQLPPAALGGLQLDDRRRPPAGAPYVPMSGRDLPGEGDLPLHALVRAALANTPGLSAEVEVFSDELRDLPPDAAASRIRAAADLWREGL